MKRTRSLSALVAALLSSFGAVHASGFTYQGTLQDAGKPADGTYDIELTLYSAADHGTVIGGPLTMLKVPVQHGAFSTKVDFGPLTKTLSQAWLGIKVRSGDSGEFAAMSERSPVNINVVDATAAICPGSWGIGGNAGNPSTSYLGTSDSNPILFKVNGNNAGQITPGKGVAFSQGAGLLSSVANGADSFAVGEDCSAGGTTSFAAGYVASAPQAGSFMWGDSQGSPITATTSIDQFIVRSAGGVGINRAPLTAATELTITGSSSAADTNVDLAMFPRGSAWGYDVNVQGTNQATDSFNLTETNGSTYTPRLTVNKGGVSMNNTGTGDGILLITNTAHTLGGIDFLTAGGYELLMEALPDSNNSNKPMFEMAVESPTAGQTALFLSFTSNGHAAINGTASDATAFQVGTGTGDTSAGSGAYLSNGGTWTNASSITYKDGFASIDPLDVLAKVIALPVKTWFYKNDHAEGRHMGPFAEDFAHTFALGNDEKHIGTVDESGVAFAAIQGLNRKLENENTALQAKLDSVLARLDQLENSAKK